MADNGKHAPWTAGRVVANAIENFSNLALAEEKAADVVKQLSEHGFCIVELPNPDSHGRWRSERWGVRDDGWLKWSAGLSEDGIPFASARRASGRAPSSAVAEHRAFAAAILAACDGRY